MSECYGFVVVEACDVEGGVSVRAGLVGVCAGLQQDGAQLGVLVLGRVVERRVVVGVLILHVGGADLKRQHVDALHLVFHAAGYEAFALGHEFEVCAVAWCFEVSASMHARVRVSRKEDWLLSFSLRG